MEGSSSIRSSLKSELKGLSSCIVPGIGAGRACSGASDETKDATSPFNLARFNPQVK